MDAHRAQRISEAIREELSQIIGYELEDPRIGMVDVTEVLVAPDLKRARVRLHLEGDDRRRAQCLLAVEGARRFLRRELATRLRLFRVPDLHFEPDVERSPAAARVGARSDAPDLWECGQPAGEEHIK